MATASIQPHCSTIVQRKLLERFAEYITDQVRRTQEIQIVSIEDQMMADELGKLIPDSAIQMVCFLYKQ